MSNWLHFGYNGNVLIFSVKTDSIGAGAVEFMQDPSYFLRNISTVNRDWTRASAHILDQVGHWQDLSTHHFMGMTSVIAKERSIEGEVLGKQFLIELNPISSEKAGLAEAVLFLCQGGERSQLGRFSIRHDGAVLNADGAVLVSPEEDRYSYKIFATILQSVIDAPTPKRAV